jgi:hypothetical protein
MICINVTDTYLLANYHGVINVSKIGNKEKEKQVSIQRFAGILAQQLVDLSKKFQGTSLRFFPEDCLDVVVVSASSASTTNISSPTINSSLQGKSIIRLLPDANGTFHQLIKYKVTLDPSGRKRTKMRKCKLCLSNNKRCNVGQYCVSCGESYSLCNKTEEREKDCFLKHVSAIKRITRQTKE